MKPRPYYSAQEPAYREIREKGEAGWLVKSFDDFRDPITKKIIENYVSQCFSNPSGKSALDLGTGSGRTAHILHDLGFDVLGIDVCPSAIMLAREIAEREKKSIRFEISDGLFLNENFDLVYDSHCAHCIVLEDDRDQFFRSIFHSLKSDGYFILDSMAFKDSDDSWKDYPTLRFDENYILWHKTNDETQTGIVQLDGILWCPQRRIYPVETILKELKDAGFKIESYEIEEQRINEPRMLRVLCKK